tara:strand:- start:55 stop:228 length:174 start_codon:yes stop_codon:yes gene_type:complete
MEKEIHGEYTYSTVERQFEDEKEYDKFCSEVWQLPNLGDVYMASIPVDHPSAKEPFG